MFYAQNYDLPAFNLKNIKSIVTKEMMESIEYKVGEQMETEHIINKLKDALTDLQMAININDIHNVENDLKRIIDELEGKNE